MTEHAEQVALIEWARMNYNRRPELRYLYAVPNGGLRNKQVAIKLKAEGVQPGVPDLWLPLPVGKYHGLVIEMKYGRNTTTPEQKNWLDYLASQDYQTAVCYTWTEAAEVITKYLEVNKP